MTEGLSQTQPPEKLSKSQKRRRRKRQLKARLSQGEVPQQRAGPEPLAVRYAKPDDADVLSDIYRHRFPWPLDFSDPYPYWIVATRGGAVVGALQLLFSKPIGMVENLAAVEAAPRARMEIFTMLVAGASEVLKQQGCQIGAGFVDDSQADAFKDFIEAGGWLHAGRGSIFAGKLE